MFCPLNVFLLCIIIIIRIEGFRLAYNHNIHYKMSNNDPTLWQQGWFFSTVVVVTTLCGLTLGVKRFVSSKTRTNTHIHKHIWLSQNDEFWHTTTGFIFSFIRLFVLMLLLLFWHKLSSLLFDWYDFFEIGAWPFYKYRKYRSTLRQNQT